MVEQLWWTVVVTYPQEALEPEEEMSYVAFVQAPDAVTARRKGAREAQQAQPMEKRFRLEMWTPLVTFEGVHYPKLYSWQTPAWRG